MKHKIITDYQKFLELRNEWNILLKQSDANTIFLTWEWLDAWWRAYRTTEQPYVILFRNVKGELAGIAPFVINIVKGGYVLNYRALYFWGIKIGVKESEYLDIIAKEGNEEEICRHVIDVLNERSNEWDVFLFHEAPESSLCLDKIKKLINDQQWLSRETSHGCSIIKLPALYENYIKTLKPRMRTKVRSLPRRLEENHKVEFEVCKGKDNLNEIIKSFFDLHQQRWEAEDQHGTFSDPKRREFYNVLSNYFVENEWLAIFSLKVDGVYRAHEFGFLYNNRLFVLQEGYNVEWERRGIGNVLRTFVLQYCIDNRLDEYDFLGGVTYHKNSWGVHIKNNVSVTIGRRNLKSIIFLYTPTVIEKFKNIYRTIVPKSLIQWRIDRINERKVRKVRETVACERSMKEVVINKSAK